MFPIISNNILQHVLHLEHSHEAWIAVECKLSSLSPTNILHLKNRLQTMMKGSSSIQDYLQQVKTIIDTLITVSLPVDDEDIILYMLNGLPPTFNAFKTAIRTRSQTYSFIIWTTKTSDYFSSGESSSLVSSTLTITQQDNDSSLHCGSKTTFNGRSYGERRYRSFSYISATKVVLLDMWQTRTHNYHLLSLFDLDQISTSDQHHHKSSFNDFNGFFSGTS